MWRELPFSDLSHISSSFVSTFRLFAFDASFFSSSPLYPSPWSIFIFFFLFIHLFRVRDERIDCIGMFEKKNVKKIPSIADDRVQTVIDLTQLHFKFEHFYCDFFVYNWPLSPSFNSANYFHILQTLRLDWFMYFVSFRLAGLLCLLFLQ